MAFKSDFKNAFQNNFTVAVRQDFFDGYIHQYSLKKPDGTAYSTNAEKADAVTEHFTAQLRYWRRNWKEYQREIALTPIDDVEIT
jgi:hypothetical protein